MTESRGDKKLPRVTKIKNYHITPKTGRVTMIFEKEEGKILKKLGIDLELPEEDTIRFALSVLANIVNDLDFAGLSAEEIKAWVAEAKAPKREN